MTVQSELLEKFYLECLVNENQCWVIKRNAINFFLENSLDLVRLDKLTRTSELEYEAVETCYILAHH